MHLRAVLRLRDRDREPRHRGQGMRMRPFVQVRPQLRLRELTVKWRGAANRTPRRNAPAEPRAPKGLPVLKSIPVALVLGALAIGALQPSPARNASPAAAGQGEFTLSLSIGTQFRASLSLGA